MNIMNDCDEGWGAEAPEHFFSYQRTGENMYHGLRREERRRIMRDMTDPWHLPELVQWHVPPRLRYMQAGSPERCLLPRRPVADALFPVARQRLLILFFQLPGHWYRQVDMQRLASLGLGVLQRELKNLREAGLIRVRVSDARRRRFPSHEYAANPDAPLFVALSLLARDMRYTPFDRPLRLPPEPDAEVGRVLPPYG